MQKISEIKSKRISFKALTLMCQALCLVEIPLLKETRIMVAIGVTAIEWAASAAIESIVEGAQPQEAVSQQPSRQPETKPKEPLQDNDWWQNFLNIFR